MTRNDEQSAVPQHLDAVDMLRGVSILAVILLHIWIRFSFFDVKLGGDWPRLARHFVFRNGGNGVTVFFAVSGFLITLTAIERFGSLARLRPAAFYRIRFARIAPLLFLMLAVLSIFHLLHVPAYRIDRKFFTLPRALFAALTFHLNWLEAARNRYLPACWTVLWSLSIEEMFYLFFPLVTPSLWKRARIGRWLWIALCLAFVVMGPWARVVWPKTDLQAENSYIAGMANIALGCLTAIAAVHFKPKPLPGWSLRAIAIAGWSILALFAIGPRLHVLSVLGRSGTDDALLAFGACLVLFAAGVRACRWRAWNGPLRWFGRHSYELYLSHEFVIVAIVGLYGRRFSAPASRGVVAAFVVAILLLTVPLAWALARWFAIPMNRWLRGAKLSEQTARI